MAVPTLAPVTSPVEPTVATVVFELVHVPPDGKHESDVVEPTHSVVRPVMLPVAPDTVTILVAVQPAADV